MIYQYNNNSKITEIKPYYFILSLINSIHIEQNRTMINEINDLIELERIIFCVIYMF